MFFDSLQFHIAVAAQSDLPSWAKGDPDFWNVISIREPDRPRIDFRAFKRIHSAIFHDVPGTFGPGGGHGFVVPDRCHLREIFAFVDSLAGEPVLIHCRAGISRSTAVALAVIARSLHCDGWSMEEIQREAPPMLVKLRPGAAPNPLVLQLGLEEFLDAPAAGKMLRALLNHPDLFAGRFRGSQPGE